MTSGRYANALGIGFLSDTECYSALESILNPTTLLCVSQPSLAFIGTLR